MTFFLWGRLKEKIHDTPIASIEDLNDKIGRVCRRIRPSVLKKVWDNVQLHLNILANNSGGHIQNLLDK